jgi:hypothetical protein
MRELVLRPSSGVGLPESAERRIQRLPRDAHRGPAGERAEVLDPAGDRVLQSVRAAREARSVMPGVTARVAQVAKLTVSRRAG